MTLVFLKTANICILVLLSWLECKSLTFDIHTVIIVLVIVS